MMRIASEAERNRSRSRGDPLKVAADGDQMACIQAGDQVAHRQLPAGAGDVVHLLPVGGRRVRGGIVEQLLDPRAAVGGDRLRPAFADPVIRNLVGELVAAVGEVADVAFRVQDDRDVRGCSQQRSHRFAADVAKCRLRRVEGLHDSFRSCAGAAAGGPQTAGGPRLDAADRPVPRQRADAAALARRSNSTQNMWLRGRSRGAGWRPAAVLTVPVRVLPGACGHSRAKVRRHPY
jgi:hypothetical protein